ncbi:MAG TPA: thioredoxin domain-containing protein [Thermoflexales bacterium]|nr:thioredoxin domain-containing protein [Thermoflexales bacterium]HQW34179.1 thioredoxin domain-containing protein [Thermoflexales bacterium]HQZ20833.1 thioredoxin domain-containing protein [Thermoflexales bacterium]HQZ99306.1 thioredoxin domain-containing protein [Thermoflexales bacterium]
MSKRRELEAQRQKKQQQQTLTMLAVIGAIAVLIIGGAVFLVNSQNNKALAPITVSNEAAPANAEANSRAWGPKDAPIQIVEWLDYQCPYCGQFATKYEKDIQTAFAPTGKVRYEVRSASFIGVESVNAAEAALCAVDQNLFWQMHHAIFQNQPKAENSGEMSKDRLKTIAAKVTGMDTSTFNQCLDSGKYSQAVADERANSQKSGIQSTPTFVVNGKNRTGLLSVSDFRKVFAEVAPTVQLGQ